MCCCTSLCSILHEERDHSLLTTQGLAQCTACHSVGTQHSFPQILKAHHVLGTVLGAQNTISKIDKILCPHGVYILMEGETSKQVKYILCQMEINRNKVEMSLGLKELQFKLYI